MQAAGGYGDGEQGVGGFGGYKQEYVSHYNCRLAIPDNWLLIGQGVV